MKERWLVNTVDQVDHQRGLQACAAPVLYLQLAAVSQVCADRQHLCYLLEPQHAPAQWPAHSGGDVLCAAHCEPPTSTWPHISRTDATPLPPEPLITCPLPLHACSVLDFWVKGSGLTSISIYLKDTATNKISWDVRFTSNTTARGVTSLGVDEDNFYHLQINLAVLRTRAEPVADSAAKKDSTKVKEAGDNGKDKKDTPVAQECDAITHFDTIVVSDISNMGFLLVLDDIKLVSAYQVGGDAIQVSEAFMPFLPITMPNMVPVLGDDLTKLKSQDNR